MFQKGDVIVCIVNLEFFPNSLTEGKRYEVLSYHKSMLYIKNDKNRIHCYSVKRFMTAQQDRRLKLNKICSK